MKGKQSAIGSESVVWVMLGTRADPPRHADMRFQVLMPDVLHWLGVKKIDNLVSMSDMKVSITTLGDHAVFSVDPPLTPSDLLQYDAIVNSGITVGRRYEIPEELVRLLRLFPVTSSRTLTRDTSDPSRLARRD